MKDAVPGVAYEAGDRGNRQTGRRHRSCSASSIPAWARRTSACFESAKFVPKGSDIVFNMHYTAIGKETTDRSKLALVFAKQPPKLRYFTHDGPTARISPFRPATATRKSCPK